MSGFIAPQISIIVPGKPRGKGRPRFGNGHAFTPASTRRYEHEIAVEAQRAVAGCLADWDKTAPMRVDILAVFPIPASWPKRKRSEAEAGDIAPQVKPDLDNVVKIALDALNGVAFEDDKQVIRLDASKVYPEGIPAAWARDGYLQIVVTQERKGEG